MKRHCLHLWTGSRETWVTEVIQAQQATGAVEITEIDLSRTDVDYGDVLEHIFRSDSVSVW